jgi:drug/metabolite transporter (DMT)-like permease
MIFAHFMANEKLKKYNAVVLLIGLGGLIFMIKPWNMQAGNTVSGIIFMLLAAVFFGWYTVAGKISVKKMGIMAQTSFSFIMGSLVLLVVIIIMGRPVFEGVTENWIAVAYVSIFVTGLGYFCYFKAIRHSDATTGSIAFFLKPAIAPVIAVIILHEHIMWNTYIGIGLFLMASYMNIRGKRKEASLNEQNNA